MKIGPSPGKVKSDKAILYMVPILLDLGKADMALPMAIAVF